MNEHLSKDGESGTSRLGPRSGPTTEIRAEPEPLANPNQEKLCMGDGSIVIGVVDRGEPITQVSTEWEFLDLECVIVSVAREESQARESIIGPGRREEEWEEWAQHCDDECEYDCEEYRETPTGQCLSSPVGPVLA